MVHVLVRSQDEIEPIRKAARYYDTTPKITPGYGEFVGTELPDSRGDRAQRDDAKRIYVDIIRAAQISDDWKVASVKPGTVRGFIGAEAFRLKETKR